MESEAETAKEMGNDEGEKNNAEVIKQLERMIRSKKAEMEMME